jgi:hypothetical protein
MNMAIKVIDRLLIVVFGILDPTDVDWQRFLKLVECHGIVKTQHLIYTDGGAPSAEQHRKLRVLIAGRVVPTAVVCDSFRVRAGLAALSLFNSSVKPFPPSGLADALRFLEVPMSRFDLVTRELQKLRAEVGQEHDV